MLVVSDVNYLEVPTNFIYIYHLQYKANNYKEKLHKLSSPPPIQKLPTTFTIEKKLPK